jgi:hypothetical protein
MTSEQDCVDFARQGERLAGLCEDELREHLLGLVREWTMMVSSVSNRETLICGL